MYVIIAASIGTLCIFFLLLWVMYLNQRRHLLNEGKTFSGPLQKAVEDTGRLIENPDNLPYSGNLRYILHNRMLRLYRILNRHMSHSPFKEQIAEQKKLIDSISYPKNISYEPPDNDLDAQKQIRQIDIIKHVVALEREHNHEIDPAMCRAEDNRLDGVVTKINVSQMFRRAESLRDARNFEGCQAMIQEAIQMMEDNPIEKDFWMNSKRSELSRMRIEVDKIIKEEKRHYHAPVDIEEPVEEAAPVKKPEEKQEKREVQALYGEKLKW